jgi:TRAP-type C4-dicarboxylate transport system permease small subunit
VTESADGDGSKDDPANEAAKPGPPADPPAAAVPLEATIDATVPPTRRHSAPALASELSARPGSHAGDHMVFPDDGPVSGWFRRADKALGVAEQAVLFVLLGAVVLTAASAALSDRVLGIRFGRWWFDIVRGGTFSVAMIGAVFASHQQRHLSMDLVSRRLPPRGRLVLRVILALFTVFVAVLLVRSGLHQLDTVGEEGGEHLVSTHTIVMFMPIGAGLIIVHTLLHMVIDLDYLARGKAPPERMRSGH